MDLSKLKVGHSSVASLEQDEKKILKDLALQERLSIKTAKDPIQKLKMILSPARLKSMDVYPGLQYDYDAILEEIKGVNASSELCADLPVEMKQSYESLSSAEQERYQKFFKEKLDKWGVKSPADLDESKKKGFFEEVKKDWK